MAADRGCGLTLIDADDRDWTTPAVRWFPDLAPATLGQFDTILATGRLAERRLRRMGVAPERLAIAGPLTEAALALDCPPALHEELAALLVGRPVWLASRLQRKRCARCCARMGAPRGWRIDLLLVLVPA